MENILLHDLRISDLVTVCTEGDLGNSMLLKTLEKLASEYSSVKFDSLRLKLAYTYDIETIRQGIEHSYIVGKTTRSLNSYITDLYSPMMKNLKSRIISFFEERTGFSTKVYGPHQSETGELTIFLHNGLTRRGRLNFNSCRYVIYGNHTSEGKVKVANLISIREKAQKKVRFENSWELVYLIYDEKLDEKKLINYPIQTDVFGSDVVHRIHSSLSKRNRESSNYKYEILNIPKSFENIVTNDNEFKMVVAKARYYADCKGNILILGDTGTGKELFANAIVNTGKRNKENFRAVNCANFSKEMLESHLFGHNKGAFTGAITNKKGILDEVNGGTLFLDEIGDLHPEIQPKLLRALESGEYYPIGETVPKVSDFRLISATNNKDIEDVDNFRRDLYFRISNFTIKLPSLLERGKDDIIYLTEHFSKKIQEEKVFNQGAYIEEGALELIGDFDWPGNVRQLLNFVKKMFDEAVFKILYDRRGDLIDQNGKLRIEYQLVRELLENEVSDTRSTKTGDELKLLVHTSDESLSGNMFKVDHKGVTNLKHFTAEIEKAYLESAIAKSGNQKEAAKILGVGQDWVSRKCKDLGIDYKQSKSRKRLNNHIEE